MIITGLVPQTALAYCILLEAKFHTQTEFIIVSHNNQRH